MMLRIAALLIAGLLSTGPAVAKTWRIVAIGASNTQGFYIGKENAFPAQLQQLLKQKGIDADVVNAGVPFDTTAAMLRRLDNDVPKGTDIVILQPGANDKRFFTSKEERTRNIAEMERKLKARGIRVVTYDEDIPMKYYTFDFIHLTRDGHTMIANWLLPRVAAIINRPAPAPAPAPAPKPAQ